MIKEADNKHNMSLYSCGVIQASGRLSSPIRPERATSTLKLILPSQLKKGCSVTYFNKLDLLPGKYRKVTDQKCPTYNVDEMAF